MPITARFFAAILFLGMTCGLAAAQFQPCPPRPAAGSVVTDPEELHSQNGVLSVDLTMKNLAPTGQPPEYCYVYTDGTEAPTLVVNPGDQLILNLTNQNGPSSQAAMSHASPGTTSGAATDCAGGAMTASSTNIHFHGLNVPPTCHGDEVIKTIIQPNDPTFQYTIPIPSNEPSGLYWYHPHPHGFTSTQVLGGAAGALVVNGLEKVRPEAAGLPERVFVIRQLSQGGDEGSTLTINFVPALQNQAAAIMTKPSEKQLWRVVNATSIFFLQLKLINTSTGPTDLQLLAVDGVPLQAPETLKQVILPPAGRAEFIVQGPSASQVGYLVNSGFNTGPGGDSNPPSVIASVISSATAPDPPRVPAASTASPTQRFAGLSNLKPTQQRHLYFSESSDGTKFFITVAGQTPKLYDPYEPPAIVTQQGAIEDWTIENRTTEVHAFHIHQLHFLVLEQNGQPSGDPAIRDTVVVPYWDGKSPQYPYVKVRMDFRDPETVGTFLYHCHILDHEDGGMMAKIKVLPAH